MFRRKLVPIAVGVASLAVLAACGSSNNSSTPAAVAQVSAQDALATATPIKHVVVIYGENVSFDHYFGTYPNATNPTGEPKFTAASGTPTITGTPSVNGLTTALLTANANATNAGNGTGATNPFRLDRTQAATADQNHAYTAEQQAYDNGAMDLFPKYTGNGTSGGAGAFGTTGQVMGYFDGNTVTAMWNYAQNFAMSDNAYTDTYGPSTPGALEVVSGQTNGMQIVKSSKSSYYVNDGQGGLTMINDVDPGSDLCSSTTDTAMMTGKNIGDLLNASNITWGGFMGGFNLSTTNSNGTTGCKRSTMSTVVGAATADYIPHHNWFQYFKSTSNPNHLRPTSTAAIGFTTVPGTTTVDPANHEYDTDDFFAAVSAGNYPSVSFLKAPAYQDAHAGYSDPLDEQAFVTKVVNFLEQQPDWKSTAVIVAWDDSDGWYDHQFLTPTSASFSTADQLNGASLCGPVGKQPNGLAGQPVNGRCGPGTRIPFLVISPYAKQNYVDHTQISQASVVRFIEDNWLGGTRLGGGAFDATTGSINAMFNFSGTPNTTPVYLDPNLGTQVSTPPQS
ncbi:phospholipase C [Trinickia dinghuensis]|uniref:Phospholipase n=1 Tax=Trinickia dinghuensis TaxID=2291023 RepID=A0A3D8K5L3_9BURK|nr:alkaline phosphatase family protein [Trinickia dinghuensis]RDV00510.1 phospholipase [Trinickia dinghuensis]